MYFAPPFELSLDYQVNHDYVLANDVLRFSSSGTSILSYEDFSDAILETLSDTYAVDNRIVSVSEQ
ncbi:hypothetical protein ACYSNW_14995 [Enterococcus sp. LJL99]